MLTEQEEGKVRNIIDAFDNGKSVTELNAATTLGNDDVMEVLQGWESKKVPVSVVKQSVNSDVLTDLNKRGVFNVTVSVPLTAGSYYTLSTAIAAVPTASKSLGLDLKFATAANTWVVYRYKGSDLTGWATTTNWEQVPDAAKLSSLETNLNGTKNDLYGVNTLITGQNVDGVCYDTKLRPADDTKVFGSTIFDVSLVTHKSVHVSTTTSNIYYKAYVLTDINNNVLNIPQEVSSIKREFDVDLYPYPSAKYMCVLYDKRQDINTICSYISDGFSDLINRHDVLIGQNKVSIENIDSVLNGGVEESGLVGMYSEECEVYNGSDMIKVSSGRSSVVYDVSNLYGVVRVTTETKDQPYFFTWCLTEDDRSTVIAASGVFSVDPQNPTSNKADGGVGVINLELYSGYKYLFVLCTTTNKNTTCIPYTTGIIKDVPRFEKQITELNDFKNETENRLDSELVYPNRWVLQKNRQSCFYPVELVKFGKYCRTSIDNSPYVNYGDICTAIPPSITVFNSTINSVVDETLSLYTKNLSIKVVDKPLSEEITIFPVGDSFTDNGHYLKGLIENCAEDGININLIGMMDGGILGSRLDRVHSENLSGGTVDFINGNTRGISILLSVTGVAEAPTTMYPSTIYKDVNNFNWACKGYKLDINGDGYIKFGRVIMDSNYAGVPINITTAAQVSAAAGALAASGQFTKNSSLIGDPILNYHSFEIIYDNPIYNPLTNSLSLSYYLNKFEFQTPDIVLLSFGINDLTGTKRTDDEIVTIINKYIEVIDSILTEYPTMKFLLIANPPCAHIVTNSSTRIQEAARRYNMSRFYELMVSNIENIAEYTENVTICPAYMFVDREKAYISESNTIVPCNRYINELKYAIDFIHCSVIGMRQISDAIVPYIYDIIQ